MSPPLQMSGAPLAPPPDRRQIGKSVSKRLKTRPGLLSRELKALEFVLQVSTEQLCDRPDHARQLHLNKNSLILSG